MCIVCYVSAQSVGIGEITNLTSKENATFLFEQRKQIFSSSVWNKWRMEDGVYTFVSLQRFCAIDFLWELCDQIFFQDSWKSFSFLQGRLYFTFFFVVEAKCKKVFAIERSFGSNVLVAPLPAVFRITEKVCTYKIFKVSVICDMG